jgi:hypothetical protein
MRAAQNMEVWLKVVFDLWGDGVKGVDMDEGMYCWSVMFALVWSRI